MFTSKSLLKRSIVRESSELSLNSMQGRSLYHSIFLATDYIQYTITLWKFERTAYNEKGFKLYRFLMHAWIWQIFHKNVNERKFMNWNLFSILIQCYSAFIKSQLVRIFYQCCSIDDTINNHALKSTCFWFVQYFSEHFEKIKIYFFYLVLHHYVAYAPFLYTLSMMQCLR